MSIMEALNPRAVIGGNSPPPDPLTPFQIAEKAVNGRIRRDPATECWLWLGALRGGYGLIRRGKVLSAHRFIYELLIGPIPEGLQLDHLCRIHACVNPAHLEPVTARVNTRRGIGPAGTHARKTHCVNGHEFTQENTRICRDIRGKPARTCRICLRIRVLRKRNMQSQEATP